MPAERLGPFRKANHTIAGAGRDETESAAEVTSLVVGARAMQVCKDGREEAPMACRYTERGQGERVCVERSQCRDGHNYREHEAAPCTQRPSCEFLSIVPRGQQSSFLVISVPFYLSMPSFFPFSPVTARKRNTTKE